MARLTRFKWWVVMDMILCPLLVFAAGPPNVFLPGTVISSAQVNDNFTAVTNRLTAVEAKLSGEAIPDIPNPSVATNAQYIAASAVRLPIYRVTPGESGASEGGASCKAGDLLLGGGCVSRETSGIDTCMVERSFPISTITWYCRAVKTTGTTSTTSECRTTPYAICLKSQ